MRRRIISIVVIMLVIVTGIGLAGSSASRAMSTGVHFTSTESPTWQVDGVVWAIGHSNGLVIAGGTFSTVRPPDGASGTPIAANGLAVLDAETGAPTSCRYNLTMSGSAPTIRAIATSDDGNVVYVGGSFVSINGVRVARLAALDPVECTVLPLRVRGIDAMVRDIAVRGDTVYLAGSFNNIDSRPRSKFAAVSAVTGEVLPFRADADQTGRAVAVSPDGTKVAVGGDITRMNGDYSHSIAVVDAVTGANVHTYPRGFIPDTSVTKDIHADAGGVFYVANEGTGGGVFDGRFAVDWNTGEQVWRDSCLGATQALLTHQGTLYSASHAHDCTANNGFPDGKRNYFLAQSTATAELYGWYPTANDGIGEGIGPRALTVATGATTGEQFLWFGGEFTRINGQPQQGLTRFGSVSLTRTPSPRIDVAATPEGTIQIRFQTVVDSDDSELTYRVYRDGSATPMWTGTAESVWWKRPQVSVVDSDVAPGEHHTYRVTASDGVHTSDPSNQVGATARAPEPSYGSVVRSDAPQLLWDSTRSWRWIQDSGQATSGTGLSGIDTESPGSSTSSPIPGDTTGSLSYDGNGDYVWEDDYRPAPEVYSIEAWINTTTNRGGKIIGFGNGRPMTNNGDTRLSGHYDRQIYMDNAGHLHFGVYIGHAETLNTQQTYNDGEWHHVVGTQGPDGMAFYVDGVLVGSNQVTTAQQYWGVWHVGGDNLNGWPNQPSSNFFAGLIDEVAAYTSVLGPQRVAAHYNATGREADVNDPPTDEIGARTFDLGASLYWRMDETSGSTASDSSFSGQRDGTYGWGVDLGEPGGTVPGTAVHLPGNVLGTVTTDVASSAPSQFAVSMWFTTTTTRGGKLFGYENTDVGDGNNYDRHLYMNDAGQLTFGTWVGHPAVVTTDQTYNDGEWHHVVAMIDPTGTKLYVDGVLRGSDPNSDSQSFAGYWRIGGGNLSGWPNTGSDSYFAGTVDEFAVFPHGLSAEQVRSLYVDANAPTTPQDVTAAVTDGQLHVAWTASTDNVGIAQYEVHGGTTADFEPTGTTRIGTSSGTDFTTGAGAPGTTWVRIVAVDATGNRSPASSAVEVVVPDTTAPAAPDGLTASLAGSTAQLSWAAATDDVEVTGYQVHRGTSADFTPDADTLVAEVATTHYDDTELEPGQYFYKVVAFDAAGNTSEPSAPATVAVGSADTTAPAAPDGLTASLAGSTAQLSWAAATDDVEVTGYQVHRGTSADFTPDADTLVAEVATTHYDDTELEPGQYFYKVVAFDAAGNTSEPSAPADVTLTPPDTTAPTAPDDVTASVSGATVSLSWSAATDDVEVTGYRVHRGTSADFTPDDSTLVAEVVTTLYDDTELEPEQYFYKVVAFDAAGNTSEPSAPADVTLTPPDTTAPTAPEDLEATTTSSTVTLSWAAATDDVGVAGYRVHRGSSAGFSPSEANVVGTSTTTSHVDSSVTDEMTYYYVVVAVDAAGNVSPASEELRVTTPDREQGTTVGADEDALVAQSVPSRNYGSSTQLGSSTNTQSYLGFTLPQAPAGTVLQRVVLNVRTSTDPTGGSAEPHPVHLMTGAWSESGLTWNNRPTTVVAQVGTVTGATATNSNYEIDLSAAALRSSLGEQVTLRISPTGSDNLRLWSSEYAAASGRPTLTLIFVPSGGGADTTAPTTPTGLRAAVSGSTVTVAWSPASDDTGVTGYVVHRGSSADFTPSSATRLGVVSAVSATDTDVPPGAYFYKVVALDAAGNSSAPSGSVSATVAEPPPDPPTVLGVLPDADAPVVGTAPTTNYGSYGQLMARNTQESFLRFTLPEAPAGTTLTAVVLQLHTSTDPTAGTTATVRIDLVDGTWSEPTVTWNNRPTTVVAALGTVTGATQTNTVYRANCVTDVIASRLGETITVRLSHADADNLRLFSREGPTRYRPELQLTFTPN